MLLRFLTDVKMLRICFSFKFLGYFERLKLVKFLVTEEVGSEILENN